MSPRRRNAEAPQNPKAYKGQPWILFDTVASRSFLLGAEDQKAIGSDGPAVTSSGEITFFQSAGRTRARMPWYTNLDVPGQLAYGMQVWQVYLQFMFPTQASNQSLLDPSEAGSVGVPPTVRLAEAILNFGELELELGQENQVQWPLSRFGAGGGLALMGGGEVAPVLASNSLPQAVNVMKLPEPVEMVRTQNFAAKIRIAPEAFKMIGTDAAPGVGSPLDDYILETAGGETPTTVALEMLPFAIQLGLVGRRIKQTQYGQLVRD